MTTFNTVEELLDILDENPHLLEALRARLLTQELLDLPASHASLVAEVRALSAEVSALSAGMSALSAEMRDFVAATNRRFDALEQKFDGLDQKVEGLDQKVEGLDQKVEGLDQKVEGLDQRVGNLEQKVEGLDHRVGNLEQKVESLEHKVERGFNRLSNDIASLKGNYAEDAVSKQAITIAFNVGSANGFSVDETTLKPLDRAALVQKASASGIISEVSQGDRASFYMSDFVAEVRDQSGEAYYIIVEASYTCDKRDTDRAIAHAKLMTRFTQMKAWPVVAGVRIDDEIRELIEGGDVFWHQLDEDDLQARRPEA